MANKAKRAKPKQKKSGGVLAVAIVGIMVLGVGFLGYRYFTNPGKDGAFTSQRVPGGERRATLDPTLFTGSVARAYQVAREIPEVLDKLYCHCQCIENSGHFSNLSCFVDRHGAG
jgi:hypothetical protein